MTFRTFDEFWAAANRAVLIPRVGLITRDQLERACRGAFDLGRMAGHLEADEGRQVDGTPRPDGPANWPKYDEWYGGGA